MWKKGENVLVYGGKKTADGFKTQVSIAEIIEVGSEQLLLRFKTYVRYNKGKIAIVKKSLCRAIEKNIHMESLYSEKIIPNVGDLVQYFITDWEGNFKVREISAVQSVKYYGDRIFVELMVNDDIKKVEVEDCLILQRANKIPKKV